MTVIGAQSLELALEGFPRQLLSATGMPEVTPLQALPRLSDFLGIHLTCKRDDLTSLAFGGNKQRQLEFYFGQAIAEGADTVLITGAVQSNFVRLATAAAAKLGMAAHIQLEHRVKTDNPTYLNSGAVLLEDILGAVRYDYPDGEDEAGADQRVAAIAARLKADGARPFIIPLSPGHPPIGALGYVACALELHRQWQDGDGPPDHVVTPSGSGYTHAGLLFGLRAIGYDMPVHGICVRRQVTLQTQRIGAHCEKIAELMDIANPVQDDDLKLHDMTLAPGYGRLSDPVIEAMRQAGNREGLILDPVYSAKALAGLFALTRNRIIAAGHTALFLATGGTPGLFAYHDMLRDYIPGDFRAD